MGNLGKTLSFIFVFVFLMSVVILPPVTVRAQSKTIVVPDNYPTIQAAIGNASAGDTVFVKKGTYYTDLGGLYINKAISLVGENSQTTIIINNFPHSFWNRCVIRVGFSNVSISGFSITSNYDSNLVGIAIIMESESQPSSCKIINNNIIGNQIGILKSNPQSSIISTQSSFDLISKNNITKNDSAMDFDSTNSTISENSIIDNSFGISVNWCSNVTIVGNIITNNAKGGLALGSWGPFFVFGNNLTDSINGSGISFSDCSNSTVYGNNIVRNKIGITLRNYELYNFSNGFGVGNRLYNNNVINGQNVVLEKMYSDYVLDEGVIGNGTDEVAWDNGTVGNYWSDYNCNGSYAIDKNNVDHYPLTQQVVVTTTTPTPTVPELSWLVIVPLLFSLLFVAVMLRHRKTTNLTR
jgi:nitrous oxidase accessory protein NosD